MVLIFPCFHWMVLGALGTVVPHPRYSVEMQDRTGSGRYALSCWLSTVVYQETPQTHARTQTQTHTHTFTLTLLLLLQLYYCRFAAALHRPINHLRPLFWLFSSQAAGFGHLKPVLWKFCLRSRKCDKWQHYNTPVSVASRLFIVKEMSKQALCPAIKPFMGISMHLERAGYQ